MVGTSLFCVFEFRFVIFFLLVCFIVMCVPWRLGVARAVVLRLFRILL